MTPCASVLQMAAIAALEGDQQCVKDIAAKYQSRRDVSVKGLYEAEWPVDTRVDVCVSKKSQIVIALWSHRNSRLRARGPGFRISLHWFWRPWRRTRAVRID
jgi:hypothetical protein